jgi:hypothetical protein
LENFDLVGQWNAAVDPPARRVRLQDGFRRYVRRAVTAGNPSNETVTSAGWSNQTGGVTDPSITH